MLRLELVDDEGSDDNYICHFCIDDIYDFQILIPKEMPEILEDDPNPFYLNLLTSEHYEGR